ncbi:receptor-like protein EIX2 [Silene latifolia]|uniref:receptor-like protein EIX2 n=1 Tax=Silene latifolia TaxID=37657 RepID=UPI003D777705
MGPIPDIISNLSYLRELYVISNRLNGTIISQVALGGLPMLEILGLSTNSLEGVLTSVHLSNLSKLKILRMGYNTELVVNISADLVPPFQLDKLYLPSYKVGPKFPIWLITQKSLTYIDISNARISDVIPISFFSSLSSKLEVLAMSQNKMYGVLPDVSITFVVPPWIELSSNNFSGAIPSFMRKASVLYLNNNNLSQGLVPLLCPQTKMPLIYLDLSNNSFSEKLPDCWVFFNKLLFLHLENNKLWGNLPRSMGALKKLNVLQLRNNNFSGELPSSLVNCTSLIILDLAHNSLNGYIPSAFGILFKSLSILTLQGNNFYGAFPSSLCRLSRLQILDFSNNRISGTIPRCIYNLKGMASKESVLKTISFSFMPKYGMTPSNDNALIIWKGKEHAIEEAYILGHVKTIDLSSNMLQGQIPEEISNLVGLKQINLSRNHLSGAIMKKIGQLTSLESLDLSHNHLSGEIPLSLAKISSLAVLDLSYNNLSGKIPDGTQLQSFTTSSYMENPGLCGAPLPKCHEDERAIIPQNLNKGQPNDNFKVGLYISVVLGFIFGFWGVCGTLVVKTSWRHAFFRFYDNIKDRLMVVANIARVWRRT